jgi:hypothetical protein
MFSQTKPEASLLLSEIKPLQIVFAPYAGNINIMPFILHNLLKKCKLIY